MSAVKQSMKTNSFITRTDKLKQGDALHHLVFIIILNYTLFYAKIIYIICEKE